MLINMGNFPAQIQLTDLGQQQNRYVLTAKSIDAKKVLINGQKVKFNKGKVNLDDFPKLTSSSLLAPFSINFWLMKD